MGGSTYQHAKQVEAAAEADPEGRPESVKELDYRRVGWRRTTRIGP
ncbi:MAG: hypothetical protein OEM32_04390 [Acidimicrobiia bacterium]|nr:hypothetical protein [Acidimicrobiia bacterium]